MLKRICASFCILLLAASMTCTLTSCAMLEPKSDMKKEILSLFPDATVVDIRDSRADPGLAGVEYVVENHGVTFTVTNTQYRSTLNIVEVMTLNDYEEKLQEHFAAELADIYETYGMTPPEKYAGFRPSKTIREFDDIERSIAALQEILALLEPHLPTEAIHDEDCLIDFDIVLSCITDGAVNEETGKPDDRKAYNIRCSRENDIDFDTERTCLRFFVTDRVKTGGSDIACTPEQLNAYPTKELTTLCINGEPFVSHDFPVSFMYDVLTEQYYTTVVYGFRDNAINGKNDYLQREIITKYYPAAEYDIQTKKPRETTYTIDNDRYRIVPIEVNEEESFEFYKNDTGLDIATFTELNHYDRDKPGHAEGAFISVDDFASLMGMRVDSVDNECVYLSTL